MQEPEAAKHRDHEAKAATSSSDDGKDGTERPAKRRRVGERLLFSVLRVIEALLCSLSLDGDDEPQVVRRFDFEVCACISCSRSYIFAFSHCRTSAATTTGRQLLPPPLEGLLLRPRALRLHLHLHRRLPLTRPPLPLFLLSATARTLKSDDKMISDLRMSYSSEI
jgi:hypothetical protein